jgi:hypothetical protein
MPRTTAPGVYSAAAPVMPAAAGAVSLSVSEPSRNGNGVSAKMR